MQYKLTPHPKDSAMIEATYTWENKSSGKKNTLLAFVVHEDCIEDEDIKQEIKTHGSAFVEMTVV